ncbi:MAG: D-tyrosyl-tRNA(Tyr) deacylase [Actinobacteria bacterium]|nr:D-tyrosyl-tRNA(Tyr) deacylase [Actinomycetota bacterium]
MRAVVQRVSRASVTVAGEVVAEIGPGLLVLMGVAPEDTREESSWLADKLAHLRIFEDDEGKMNRSLLDAGGQALVVSQFTLYGDARRGRRPSFIRAARGPDAEAIYEEVMTGLRALGVGCAGGRFGATMDVELVNAGPVTILLDSEKAF